MTQLKEQCAILENRLNQRLADYSHQHQSCNFSPVTIQISDSNIRKMIIQLKSPYHSDALIRRFLSSLGLLCIHETDYPNLYLDAYNAELLITALNISELSCGTNSSAFFSQHHSKNISPEASTVAPPLPTQEQHSTDGFLCVGPNL